MILRELYELYNRLVRQGVVMPTRGCSMQKISYRIVLKYDGTLVRIEDAREVVESVKVTKKGTNVTRKKVPVEKLVLGESKPSGTGLNPCFLWDNPAYLLGCPDVKERAGEYFKSLKNAHLSFESQIASARYSAVCRFLENWIPVSSDELGICKEQVTANGVFRIEGEENDVHEDANIQNWWTSSGRFSWRETKSSVVKTGMCLVTGEQSEIAVTHEPAIKNVIGAQSSGAKLVSFNCDSFESYGKEQSSNSPVSEAVAFAYCNSLNYLLNRKISRVNIADTTVVFWTDAPNRSDDDEIALLAGAALDPERLTVFAQDDALVKRIHEKLHDIVNGYRTRNLDDASTRFFILGLSANAARLSVRFYHESSLCDFYTCLSEHFEAMQLQPPQITQYHQQYISPYMIMKSAVREAKDIPPYFSGALMRAILSGVAYPDSIALAILRRLKINPSYNYVSCAYLKAWLSRKQTNYSLKPMLDTSNTQPGYVLGRLFAVLQKTQDNAYKGGLNRTIQDSYYGSASTSPQSVFPRILRLNRHHLAKIESLGLRVIREKAIQEIMGMLDSFPARLSLEQQGLFALGYYHQTQSFYTDKKYTSETN